MVQTYQSLGRAHLILCLLLGLTSTQAIDSLNFDILLKQKFADDNKELTNPVTLNLKTAIENKFSEVLVPFTKEFESADVIQFSNKDGQLLASCGVTFSAPFDLSKESLLVFHIRSLLDEAGWKILTENGHVEIQVLFYKVFVRVNDKEEAISVALNTSNKCQIFDLRGACANGGTCHVQEDNPVCWCPRNYIGTYCEEVYTASNLDLRLVGGGFSWGFLEVTSAFSSGLVCASDWAESTLQVACRQLGFQGGQRLNMPGAPLYSSKTILLDHVRCFGNETNLGWCLHSQAQSSVCTQDQQLIVLCSDVTDVMKFTLAFKRKSHFVGSADLKALRESLASKFNSVFQTIEDFSFTDVLSLSETPEGFQTDFQIMYNHRMGPVRQAVAIYSLAGVIEAEKDSFILDNYGNLNLAVWQLHLTSTNNNPQFKLNVSLTGYDACKVLNVKKSCMNGGKCEVLSNAPYCKCPDGFTGSFCEEDIDECSKKSTCAHVCENIVGGYFCRCNDTFKSFDEGRVCEQMTLPVKLSGGGVGWGRVEISNLGQWGSVCLHGWDNSDAEVVCRDLGFPGSYATFHADAVMKSTYKPIWLSGLSCVGTEKTLDECPHGRWSMHDCKHNLDVGLICNHVVNMLQFEITLGMPWISEYESSSGPLTMSLRQDLQDKFSDLFVEHASSDGLGSVDVLKFSAGPDGSTIAIMEVIFEYQLDVTSQSLAAFFLMDAVMEAGGQFQMPSLPVTVPIREISVKTQESSGKTVKVVLSEANRCALFNLKGSCLSGSHCDVEGYTPVCKCPLGREGLYCERVPIVEASLATPDLSFFYRVLVTEQRQFVVNIAIDWTWKPTFSDRNNKETTELLNKLKESLLRLYRGVKDKLGKITIVELYPAGNGFGYLHMAEFVQDLSPGEQAYLATRILREIEDHDNCIQIEHSWVRVIRGPYLRLQGRERDTFSELTLSRPCSLHNVRSLCQNGGYCIDDIGLPQCFCSSYYTGDFCEIELISAVRWIDLSVFGSFLIGTLAFVVGMAALVKGLHAFRHYMHRHILSDYNANIISAKTSGWKLNLRSTSYQLSGSTHSPRHNHLERSPVVPHGSQMKSSRYYP